ncbi:hypothetical protein H7H82_07745 [Mycobacterium heidelbergense]|nr:hypothetical protein [Mycobacterium heidelbergense]
MSFGDEGSAQFDEPDSGLGRDLGGLVGIAAGLAARRRLAISSVSTKTLPGSSGASVSSTKVDLPAPWSDDQVETVHRVATFTSLVARIGV